MRRIPRIIYIETHMAAKPSTIDEDDDPNAQNCASKETKVEQPTHSECPPIIPYYTDWSYYAGMEDKASKKLLEKITMKAVSLIVSIRRTLYHIETTEFTISALQNELQCKIQHSLITEMRATCILTRRLDISDDIMAEAIIHECTDFVFTMTQSTMPITFPPNVIDLIHHYVNTSRIMTVSRLYCDDNVFRAAWDVIVRMDDICEKYRRDLSDDTAYKRARVFDAISVIFPIIDNMTAPTFISSLKCESISNTNGCLNTIRHLITLILYHVYSVTTDVLQDTSASSHLALSVSYLVTALLSAKNK